MDHPSSAGVARPARGRAVRDALLAPGGGAALHDWLLGVVIVVAMLWLAGTGPRVLANPAPLRLAFVTLAAVFVLLRPYRPGVALVATVLIEALALGVLNDSATVAGDHPIGAYAPVPLATMAAVFCFASRRRVRQGWTAGALAAVVLAATAALTHPLALLGTDLLMTEAVLLATGLGTAIRTRTDQRQAQREQVRRDRDEAVLAERLRIARELHDALAHNLTLVNTQAATAEFLLDTNPDLARSALHGITDHTEAALNDLRATIGLLRREHDGDHETATAEPVPGLAALPMLVERFREAGVAITIKTHGRTATLSQQVDLAAYRVVQEAATNAAKYAAGTPITITFTWQPGWLEITITNPAPPHPSPSRLAVDTGHGLLGMQERVTVAGGRFHAGPAARGGYAVSANLPTLDDRSREGNPQ